MIAFDLECSNGHIFEGWFNNTASFEDQKDKRMIICPFCDDTDVKKVISPVAMKTSSKPFSDGPPIDYEKLAKEMINYIQNNFDDVGANFAKEALKMHYGVTEKKNIKGSATAEEEKLLKEEGIHFFKIPVSKAEDDKN